MNVHAGTESGARPIQAQSAAPDPAPVEDVARLVHEVRRALHEEYSRQAKGTALEHIQQYMPVLHLVIRRPGITINELARHSQLPKSGVSVMMARLVEMGIVRKEPDPHDSRLVRVELTQEGRRRVQTWRAANHRTLARTLKHLSDDQMAIVVTGLQVLLSALQQKEPT